VQRISGKNYVSVNLLNLTGSFNHSSSFDSTFYDLSFKSSLSGEGELTSTVNGSKGLATLEVSASTKGSLKLTQSLIVEGSIGASESLTGEGRMVKVWAIALERTTSTNYELLLIDMGWPLPKTLAGSLNAEVKALSSINGFFNVTGDGFFEKRSSSSPTGNYSATSEAYNVTLSLITDVKALSAKTTTMWYHYGYGSIPTINETFSGPDVNLTNYLTGEGYPYEVNGSINCKGPLIFQPATL